MKNIIGFWGYIDPSVVKEYKKLYPEAVWVDLDICYDYPQTKLLPEAYCRIIKNIFDNAFYLKDKLIVILAPIGKDKCDSAFFASEILRENGFNVVQLKSEECLPLDKLPNTPISKSNIPLKDKIQLITNNITERKKYDFEECKPRFGFWGVPPHDLSILDLFPNDTHVFGWLRCVEADNPSNIELETYVDPDLPTVFYSQTFCAKNQLAKYLANKYGGIYIDVDGMANNSIKAKIEAFLRLR